MLEKVEEAIKRIESGDVDEGLSLLQEVVSRGDAEARFQAAFVYQELGHANETVAIVDNLLDEFPGEGSLLTLKAEAAIDLGDEDTAIGSLEQIDANDEVFVESLMLLADLYQLQGLEEVAEQKLLLAYEHAPDEAVLLAGIGSYYVERGNYQKAIPFLKQAVANGFDLEEANLSLMLAEAYSGTGAFETALSYYEQAIDERAEPRALFGYGLTALRADDSTLAIEQLEALREKDPAYSSLYLPLIEAYEKENKIGLAKEVADAGILQDEENEQLYVVKSRLEQDDQPDLAKPDLYRALELNPGNFQAAKSLLDLLFEEEETEEMYRVIEKLRDAGEEDPLYTYYKGKAKHLEDEVEEALVLYEEVRNEIRNDGEAMEEFGYLLIENGRRKDGFEALRQAVILQEDNAGLAAYVERLIQED